MPDYNALLKDEIQSRAINAEAEGGELDGQRFTAAAEARRLAKEGRAHPSERQIRNWINEALSFSPERKREFLEVRWPNTFEEGVLPWESARTTLDLVRFLVLSKGSRPTVEIARWFWWVTKSAPNAPISLRHKVAQDLILYRASNCDTREIEWWLAFEPWTDEGAEEYIRTCREYSVPLYWPIGSRVSISAPTSDQVEAMIAAGKFPNADRERLGRVMELLKMYAAIPRSTEKLIAMLPSMASDFELPPKIVEGVLASLSERDGYPTSPEGAEEEEGESPPEQ